MRLFSSKDTYKKFEEDYREKRIRYVELKDVLAKNIYEELKPIQEKRKEFLNNPQLVDSIIEEGIQKCLLIAKETIREVKEKMGLS